MKTYFKILGLLLLPLALLTCKKDEHSLGEVLDKSEVKYSVTQDLTADAGGNTVVMQNFTPGTLSLWDYGTGTSRRMKDTVKFAFAGDYVIKFSVSSGGQTVELDSVIVKVTADNLNYVNDPLWTALSGGVGQQKEWVLDTEGEVFNGPIYFYGVNNGWLEGGDSGCYGTDCWSWQADTGAAYPNIMAKGDYGIMTFGLIGTASFKAVKPMENGVTETGTYYLNATDKTLTINNGSILRGYKPAVNGIKGISDWTHYKIFSLNENSMQLGVLRDKDVDGEGQCTLVYNFILKPVTAP